MNLVPLQIDFNSIEVEEHESEASIEGKITQLEQQRSSMRKHLEVCIERSKKGSTILSASKDFCDLERRHAELMDELQRRELERLKNEMQSWQDPEKIAEAEEIIARMKELEDAPHKAPEATERVRTSDKELKRMYKKLMNAIHPDRVKNARLNALVPLVTSLYDRGDYYAMAEIYKQVCSSTGNIKHARENARKFLLSLMESLKSELATLHSKIQDTESLLAHHVYFVAQQANEGVAVQFAMQQLQQVVNELEERLYPKRSFVIRTNFGSNTVRFF